MARLSSALVLLAAVVWLVFTGPRQLDRYPAADNSPYRLPWTTGESFLCVQGNRAVVSHRGRDEFAYDFAMPEGTTLRAARGGRVQRIVQSHEGHGPNHPNNLVVIEHEDGTLGWYLHIFKDGALVSEGESVKQGEPIALSGHVGRSMLPHLHFHVTDAARKYLRVTFRDVREDRGIPRMSRSYTAGAE